MLSFRSALLAGIIILTALPAQSADPITDCYKQLESKEYELAVESGRKAVDAANRNVDAHFCLAEAWRIKGDLRLAQQQMKTADILSKDNEYLTLKLALKEITQEQFEKLQVETRLKVSNGLAVIAAGLREYDQALDDYRNSIKLAIKLDNKDEHASALAGMAGVNSAMGEYAQALENYRDALKLTTREAEISSLYNNMAVVYGYMGNFPAADEYFDKSLTLDEKLGDKRAQAIHLLNKGMNRQAKKEYSEAAAIFSKSRQISRDQKDAYWEGAAYRHFGDMYRELGNMRLALSSYTAARERFSAAHVIREVNSMAALIDDLGEPQPIAGIEVGSTGVKTLLFALRTAASGDVSFKEILNHSTASVNLQSKQGDKLLPEDIESIAAGVVAANKQLVEERSLDRSVLSVMVTGIPAAATNLDELVNRIKQDTGITPLIMSSAVKARYDFSGSVVPGKESNGLLLKVSDTLTGISVLDAGDAVLSVELPQGAFTAVRKLEKSKKSSLDKTYKTELAAFRQALKKAPEFAGRKTIYLEGDVARVLAVFTRPDKDGNLVRIKSADLDKFITAVDKKASSYFNPNLKKIKDAGVKVWAEGEINWVKQNFVPNDLMAGVKYIKMLMNELKVKEIHVSRGGSWLAGRVYESARKAEKLEK